MKGPSASSDAPSPAPTRETDVRGRGGCYGTTLWTVIHQAQRPTEGLTKDQAARTLYDRYREPVLRQFKKHGFSDPEGLCDDFFAKVFFPKLVTQADPSRGRFRGFLGKVLAGFIIDALRRKRGDPLAEALPVEEPEHPAPMPSLQAEIVQVEMQIQREIDRGIAEVVIGRAFASLRLWYEERGKGLEFTLLSKGVVRPLGGLAPDRAEPYVAIAEALNTTEGTVKQKARDYRQRLRENVLTEVRDIAPPGEVEAEARYLLGLYLGG